MKKNKKIQQMKQANREVDLELARKLGDTYRHRKGQVHVDRKKDAKKYASRKNIDSDD